MEYKITKKKCKGMIRGICSRCGGKIEPIETVDNGGSPTYWAGCTSCMVFDNGVTLETYEIAKRLVEERHYRHYSHMSDNIKDDEEMKRYKKGSQISGTCGLVRDVLKIREDIHANN